MAAVSCMMNTLLPPSEETQNFNRLPRRGSFTALVMRLERVAQQDVCFSFFLHHRACRTFMTWSAGQLVVQRPVRWAGNREVHPQLRGRTLRSRSTGIGIPSRSRLGFAEPGRTSSSTPRSCVARRRHNRPSGFRAFFRQPRPFEVGGDVRNLRTGPRNTARSGVRFSWRDNPEIENGHLSRFNALLRAGRRNASASAAANPCDRCASMLRHAR